MTTLIKSDLVFILDQVRIAEQNAAGAALSTLVADPLLPDGLRLVDGTFNNLLPGQQNFGAADQVFPRALTPILRNAGPVTIDLDGPGPMMVGTPTTYVQTSGFVFDAQPRLASNLVVDQSPNNPAAVAAAGDGAVAGLSNSYFIPNVATDVGLSAPYNSWFTLFGQFFDHGLDLTNKGGAGTVVIPIAADDPLVTHGADGIAGNDDDNLVAAAPFMMVTRATVVGSHPGPDGLMGTSDDVRDNVNQTTPWVDQNQTYTSHPSHQVFLREYALNGLGDPVSTGRLIDGATGGIGNWAEVKAQARTLLGIELTDADVTNVPRILTDAYGKFIPGPNGNPQLILADGVTLREGDLASPVSTDGTARTGHAFLDDIAHSAAPRFVAGVLAPDADGDTGNTQSGGTYDNELLDRHFITGDGRGNENIGLTAVHTIFHAEHNRLVEHVKDVALATGDVAHLNQWLLTPVPTLPASTAGLDWNGERLFQAARFGTEMQYQHLVFEEFARKVQPEINPFAGYSTNIDPAIMAEFAHVVYRFGHSMLTETVDRVSADGVENNIGLIQAFLNPVEFDASGSGAMEATANIVRGMTRQVGNEIDEFVTGALRNNLVGLPLDLAAINMARGRDTGIPGLNDARRMFFNDTNGNSALRPYESWVDFGLNLKHPESLINFVAAYGTHESITNATTMAGKRLAAKDLVDGTHVDSASFMNIIPTADSGLDDVDFWLGGLAEKQLVFGGLLGSTFNFVFETQMEKLQDGDRLYYLSRLAGMNLFTELEANSFAALIERNLPGVKHLPGDVFSTPAFTVELSALGTSGPILNDPGTPIVDANQFVRMGDGTIRYTGVEHIVMGGTDDDDRMRGSEGDDTFHGDDGNDRIEGGDGNDFLIGGDGDDILTDLNGIDNFKGGKGNDVINTGPGFGDLALGGDGSDFVVGGDDGVEVFAGNGNDFVRMGASADIAFGDAGDDWIEGGDQADLLQGDMGDPFQASLVIGNDVIIGGTGNDDYDAESGDDIMVSDGGTERHEGMLGFDWVTYKGDAFGANADLAITGLIPITDEVDALRDRFDLVEGLSGWRHADTLRGTNNTSVELSLVNVASGFNNSLNNSTQIDLISGLQAQLGAGATSFNGGDIILGGDGSDIIEGRAGNDIIDGDAWLNVRLSIRDSLNPAVEIGTADSMGGVITGGPFGGTTLSAAMFAGTINPGQLQIVRQITTAGADAIADVDVAVFSDVRAAYDIATVFDALTGISTTTVVHARPTAGVLNDGTDTLRKIELLRFIDEDVNIGQQPGGGAILISDMTPTEGALLTADASGVSDPNFIVGPLSYRWQVETAPGAFVDVAGATGDNFTPTQDQVLSRLRVVVSYTDGLGNAESVFSTPTGAVGDLITGTPDADPLVSFVSLTGTNFDDNIIGLAGDDVLSGLAGSDILDGGDGNDMLDGGSGVDRMAGGAGDDTYDVDDAVDLVEEDVGAGTDTVQTAISHTLAANVENLVLTGAASINGTGNELDNQIAGNGAANVLNGGSGADAMAGKAGNDTYEVDNAGDTVTEIAGEGTADHVRSSIDWTLGAEVENLTLIDGAITGTGNALNNVLNGNALANTLDGLAGADAMDGDAGNDTYEVDNAGDTVTESAGGGTADHVRSSVTWTLGAEVENLTLMGASAINGTGNALNNVLTGNAQANTLNGLAGADAMAGGAGDDTYVVDNASDTVDEVGGGGTDLVQSSLATFTLGDNVENLELTGAAITGIGNGDANTITGNALANTLNGMGGADTLIGLAGNDTYLVDDSTDVIVEANLAGTDLVQSSAATYTLSADVENLTLVGTAITGNGNATANTITGNALNNVLSGAGGSDSLVGGLGNDTLDGGTGNDTMTGGAGNDTYVVDSSADVIVEGAAAGTDLVQSSAATFTLGANVENLTLIGAGANSGTGNALANAMLGNDFANTLSGLAGNDTLNGGGGADILVGGLGTDRLTGGLGADTFRFSATNESAVGVAARDIIADFLKGTDIIDLSGIDARLNGAGSAGNQAFTTWVGNGAFTGQGQLGYSLQTVGGIDYTVIRGNVNNNNAADFGIALQGNHTAVLLPLTNATLTEVFLP